MRERRGEGQLFLIRGRKSLLSLSKNNKGVKISSQKKETGKIKTFLPEVLREQKGKSRRTKLRRMQKLG